VNAANFSTDATGQGSATLNGTLSALPFGGLTNQTCFNATSLGTATDTYRVRTWLMDRQIALDRQLMWCMTPDSAELLCTMSAR